MDRPLRCFVVEVVRGESAKPVLLTGSRQEAEAFCNHFNHWAMEEGADARGHAMLRRATCLYSRLPYEEAAGTGRELLEGGAI